MKQPFSYNKVVGLLLGSVGIFFSLFSMAEEIQFLHLNGDIIKDYFSPVHFNATSNNFGGGFFWLQTVPVTTKIKDRSNKEITCKRKIRGYYYNALRGNRLRPLDTQTLTDLQAMPGAEGDSYDNLTIEGGLYTNCEGQADVSPYGRYGVITYKWNGASPSHLVAGIQINFLEGTITGNFMPSFEAFDNKAPLGFIYDTQGGIGFVGGIVSDTCYSSIADATKRTTTTNNNINDIFVYTDTTKKEIKFKENASCVIDTSGAATALASMWSISVQGNVAMTKAMSEQDRQSIQGNMGNKSSVQNTNINLANVLAQVQPKAEELCRGKWLSTNVPTSADWSKPVICVKFTTYGSGTDHTVKLPLVHESGRTLVVYNGNVAIQGSMDQNKYINVFINNGNLLLTPGTLQDFDGKGFITATTAQKVAKGTFLQGNFIINGLVLGYDGTNIQTTYPNKVYLHGKLGTVSSPIDPAPGKIKQAEEIPAANSFTGSLNLQNVFTWMCNFGNSKGSDNSPCGNIKDEHTQNSLIFISKEFSNPLLQ